MKKDKNYPDALAWFIGMLPYEIGLLFVLFGNATLIQVLWWGFIIQLLIIFLVFVFRHPLIALLGLFIGLNN